MRVLVTGGAGFIGSHLAERLVGDGHEVSILDDLSTGRLESIAHLVDDPRVDWHLGSVLDPAAVAAAMAGCTHVAHLAAAVGVRLVIERPLESLQTNLRGSLTVLDEAHRVGARVLFTSSSEVYGRNDEGPLHEDDDRRIGTPQVSRWSYSEAKAVVEALLHAHHRQSGLETVTARLFNTVGPRQTGLYGMVVPRLVSQALRGDPMTVYGDGSASRCFCHVDDVVDALAALLVHPEATGRVVNVGSTEEVSVEELAHRIRAVTGSSSKIEYVPFEQVYGPDFEEMPRRVPDTTRIQGLLGWTPAHDLDAILRDVVADLRS